MTESIAERHIIEADVETTGLQWWSPAEMFMAQFFDPEDPECVFWPEVPEGVWVDPEEPAEPELRAVIFRHPEDRDEIQRWLDKDAYFRAHNSKFDLHFFESAAYTLPPQDRWEDNMVVAHVLDERRSVALQAIGDKMFGTPDQDDAAGNPKVWPEGAGIELEKAVKAWLSTENKKRRKHSKDTGERFVIANYSDVPDELMEPYAAHDVELQRRIADAIVPVLDANPDLVEVYDGMERKVLAALFDVEKLGMGIDESGAEKLEVELENELTKIRLDIFDLAGDDEFNPNSPKQVEEAMLRRGVDISHVEKSKKTGRRSMAADVLEGLDDDLARRMEDFRGADKLFGTYVWPLLHDQPDTDMGYRYASLAADGRLHTDLRQVGARTGRMSSSPNVQNWPRDDLRMRHLVMADEGKKLVAVDLDSIELVIFAAFLGRESIILNMIKDGEDMHSHTAKQIGLTPRDRGMGIVESPRQRGKKFNYERIYGGGIKAIKKFHGVDDNTARKWLARYNEAYPEVEEFGDMIELRLEETGYVKTLFGRRHRAYNPQFADRESYKFINYLCQGTAADLFKIAVVRTHEAGIPMIALTHDEILAEVDAAEAPEAMKLIQEYMCDFPRINKLLQITAGGDIVDRWSQAKDPDFDPGW